MHIALLHLHIHTERTSMQTAAIHPSMSTVHSDIVQQIMPIYLHCAEYQEKKRENKIPMQRQRHFTFTILHTSDDFWIAMGSTNTPLYSLARLCICVWILPVHMCAKSETKYKFLESTLKIVKMGNRYCYKNISRLPNSFGNVLSSTWFDIGCDTLHTHEQLATVVLLWNIPFHIYIRTIRVLTHILYTLLLCIRHREESSNHLYYSSNVHSTPFQSHWWTRANNVHY